MSGFLTIKPTDGRLAILAKVAVFSPGVFIMYPACCLVAGAMQIRFLGFPEIIEQFKRKGWRK